MGEAKPLSQNMQTAAEAIRYHFPLVKVAPVIVLMPTDRGEGEVVDVCWPGEVPAKTLTEFLTLLSSLTPTVPYETPSYQAAIRLSHLR